MEGTYKINIASPEKLVFSDEDIKETVLPSYEGEIGILKDHISIISFLKPGIIKIIKSPNEINNFFVEDGIIEFSNNNLTILSSKIVNLKELNKTSIEKLILDTDKILNDEKLDDNNRYLANHKRDVLQSLNLN